MSKFIDLTGQRFGRLVVTASWEKRTTPNGITKPYWLCKCDCGNEKWVTQKRNWLVDRKNIDNAEGRK